MRTEKGARQLGNQFLAGISLIAEALRQVAIQTGRMRGPMAVMPISA
jgi:hypothetical protein